MFILIHLASIDDLMLRCGIRLLIACNNKNDDDNNNDNNNNHNNKNNNDMRIYRYIYT
jgi:hypothetical protein